MSQPIPIAKRLPTLLLSLILLVTSIGLAPAPEAPDAPNGGLPPGFSDSLVTNLASPTALAFTPDGRMLITRQGGSLRVFQNGSLLVTPALDLASVAQWGRSQICSNSERGLLGVTVDPDFTNNRYIYLFYTYQRVAGQCPTSQPVTANHPVNRVARFVLPDDNVIVTTTQTVLVDNMPSTAGNHNAGDVNFGNDGYLYISIGDGGCDYAGGGCAGSNDAARDEHVLTGKLLRITRDGDIPAGNPFQGVNDDRCNVTGATIASHRCQETYAWGLRNPFRFAMDPNSVSNNFLINDVGQGAWEEIDLGQSGVDYGWNCREGAHTNNTTGPCNPTPANMIDPVYEYSHGTGCYAITGGAFIPNGVWPDYDGQYFFADYGCGQIFTLSPAYTVTTFATGLGTSSAVHMEFGPYQSTQALYYTTYAGGGQVRRISLSQSPTAAIAATPTSGPAPLFVTFDATGSADPDNDPLVFDWDFGDGITNTTSSITTTYTYTTPGIFTATVIARDSFGLTSAPAAIEIQPGNTAPTPTILSPLTDTLFAVGQVITLTGVATDTQDGTLPDNGLKWNVLLHHIDINNPGNAHTHPYVTDQIGNNITFTAPAPEGFDATALSYLEVLLTASDSLNLAATITQTLEPQRVNVTFATAPSGLQLILNSAPYTAPQTLVGWEAWAISVQAPNQMDGSNQSWVFDNWSDGGAAAHTLNVPATSETYTATFMLVNYLYLPIVHR